MFDGPQPRQSHENNQLDEHEATAVVPSQKDSVSVLTTPPRSLSLMPDLETGFQDGEALVGDATFGGIDEIENVGPQMFSEPADPLSLALNDARIAESHILALEDDFLDIVSDVTGGWTVKNAVTDTYFQMNNDSDSVKGKELQLLSTMNSSSGIQTGGIGTTMSSEIVMASHFSKTVAKTSIQQTCAAMIIDLIHAYPRMMTRRETLPPFMHAFSPDLRQDQANLPENISNCMGIAQLFAVRNEDTHSFVWATMRAEMRRLRNRQGIFDKYGSFSALQACLLYLIIRAVDNSPQKREDDYEMLIIYDEVCKCAIQLGSHSTQIEAGPEISWEDWIYLESMFRVACVWYILGIVFHTRTGRPCYTSEHFREIVLPCTKSEWEAKTESQWRKEHNYALANSTVRFRTFGELIDAHKSLPDTQTSKKLSIWNAGIDHLGMVMNLAVKVVS